MLEQQETTGDIENSQKLLLWGFIFIIGITRHTLNVNKCIYSMDQVRTYCIEYFHLCSYCIGTIAIRISAKTNSQRERIGIRASLQPIYKYIHNSASF